MDTGQIPSSVINQPDLDITADNCPGDGGVIAAEEKSQLRHGATRDERSEECKSCQVYPDLLSLGVWNADFNVQFDFRAHNHKSIHEDIIEETSDIL